MVALSPSDGAGSPPSGGPPRTRRRLIRGLVSLVVAVALVAGLSLITDLETLTSVLHAVDPTWLALSFLVFCITQTIRAQCFSVLCRPHDAKNVVPFLRVTALHQMLLMVLPLRMGELSYPVLMQRYLGRAIPHGVGDLVIVRLLDLVLAATCFGLGLVALPRSATNGSEMLVAAGVIVALGVFGLLRLSTVVRLSRKSLLRARRLAPRLTRSARRFLRDLDHSVHRAGRKTLASVAALSIAATVTGTVRVGFLFAAFGVETGLFTATLLFGASNVLGLIPLHGFGGLGPKQAGMAGILVILGVAATKAASLMLLYQATIVLFVGTLALLLYGSWLSSGRSLQGQELG